MTLEEAVVAYLVADTTLTALVSQRIYPVQAPQATTVAYVTYERVTGNPFQDHGGSGGVGALCWARLSFSACAQTYTAAKAIVAEIRARLDGFRGTLSGVVIGAILSEEDADLGLDDQTRMQMVAVDFRILYYT